MSVSELYRVADPLYARQSRVYHFRFYTIKGPGDPLNTKLTAAIAANRELKVGAAGFEPATSRTRTVRSSRAEPRPDWL